MAYRTEDLLQECAAIAGGGEKQGNSAQSRRAKLFNMSMPGLSLTTFDAVWNSVLQCIRSNMKMKRGTRLPSFGRVVFAKGTKMPFFVMNEAFSTTNKIKFRQDIKAPELPSVDLNFSKIGQLAKCTKDVAKSIYRELLSRMGEVISDADNTVHMVFKGIGALHGNRFDLRFTFGTGGPGGKIPRATSAASFTKNAPATAAGLSVISGAAGVNAEPQSSSRSQQLSARSASLRASASVPSLRKGLAVSSGIRENNKNQQLSQRRQQSSRKSNRGVPSRVGKLPLNSLVTKKGYEPSYLSTEQLKDLNLKLMSDQQTAAKKARLADERDFRESVLRLHAEATKEAEEINKEIRRREEFSQQQALHAQRVEARKFAERNEDLEAGQKLHWPFSKEEDEREKRHANTQQFKDTLDKHMELRESMDMSDNIESQVRPRREVEQPDPQDKETWVKPSEGNIYPKFLTPSLVPSRIAGSFQATPVMKLGYERYAKDLKSQLKRLKQQDEDIANRKKAQEDEIKRRDQLRRKIQASTIKYQAKQVEFDRKRRKEEHDRQFLQMDPDPGAAYPLEKLRDINRLDRIKAGLRNALDAQVHAKNTIKSMNKTIETAEDNYFLGCVQEQLELDRNFRARKKQEEQRALMSTWNRQEAISEQIKKMELMRDGLVCRNGSKIETIDDVSEKYEQLLADTF